MLSAKHVMVHAGAPVHPGPATALSPVQFSRESGYLTELSQMAPSRCLLFVETAQRHEVPSLGALSTLLKSETYYSSV